ncbi:hypothetical protein GYMLUDRAFT_69845 [Collybiopsis luxurians FD-317 M1]|nr:hypothetical protein GYMLUDRAFT_69845 [Collybiopsis luxurians FD-317 M1]
MTRPRAEWTFYKALEIASYSTQSSSLGCVYYRPDFLFSSRKHFSCSFYLNCLQTLLTPSFTMPKDTSTPSRDSSPESNPGRPPNAWIFYRKERDPQIRDASETPIIAGQLSKIISEEWNNMDDEKKRPYYDKAAVAEAEHKAKYPNYKFQPNKKPKQKRKPGRKPKNPDGVPTQGRSAVPGEEQPKKTRGPGRPRKVKDEVSNGDCSKEAEIQQPTPYLYPLSAGGTDGYFVSPHEFPFYNMPRIPSESVPFVPSMQTATPLPFFRSFVSEAYQNMYAFPLSVTMSSPPDEPALTPEVYRAPEPQLYQPPPYPPSLASAYCPELPGPQGYETSTMAPAPGPPSAPAEYTAEPSFECPILAPKPIHSSVMNFTPPSLLESSSDSQVEPINEASTSSVCMQLGEPAAAVELPDDAKPVQPLKDFDAQASMGNLTPVENGQSADRCAEGVVTGGEPPAAVEPFDDTLLQHPEHCDIQISMGNLAAVENGQSADRVAEGFVTGGEPAAAVQPLGDTVMQHPEHYDAQASMGNLAAPENGQSAGHWAEGVGSQLNPNSLGQQELGLVPDVAMQPASAQFQPSGGVFAEQSFDDSLLQHPDNYNVDVSMGDLGAVENGQRPDQWNPNLDGQYNLELTEQGQWVMRGISNQSADNYLMTGASSDLSQVPEIYLGTMLQNLPCVNDNYDFGNFFQGMEQEGQSEPLNDVDAYYQANPQLTGVKGETQD